MTDIRVGQVWRSNYSDTERLVTHVGDRVEYRVRSAAAECEWHGSDGCSVMVFRDLGWLVYDPGDP